VGASFGKHRIGEDDQVMQWITSANIDCGWHAGDPVEMDRTVRLALGNGVGVGAHPGFPDLMGFGQRNLHCSPHEIVRYLLYQIGALAAFCRVHSVPLVHVKPAGNLYLMAVEQADIAKACAEAVARFDTGLILVTLAGRKGEPAAEAGRAAGLKVAREFFADRAYTPEGTLVSRRLPGSLITDPTQAAERVLEVLEEGSVRAIDGTRLDIEAHTVCVHSFQPGSATLARTIREAVEREGGVFRPLRSLPFSS
jgi:UPF0271 protein